MRESNENYRTTFKVSNDAFIKLRQLQNYTAIVLHALLRTFLLLYNVDVLLFLSSDVYRFVTVEFLGGQNLRLQLDSLDVDVDGRRRGVTSVACKRCQQKYW